MVEIETEIAMRGRVVKESCTRAQYGSTLSNGTVAMPKASQPFVDCRLHIWPARRDAGGCPVALR